MQADPAICIHTTHPPRLPFFGAHAERNCRLQLFVPAIVLIANNNNYNNNKRRPIDWPLLGWPARCRLGPRRPICRPRGCRWLSRTTDQLHCCKTPSDGRWAAAAVCLGESSLRHTLAAACFMEHQIGRPTTHKPILELGYQVASD
jgi:hypothetical protein